MYPKKCMVMALGLAGLLSSFSMAYATWQSSTVLPVQANVVADCQLTTINDILFGNYDPIGINAQSPLTAYGSFTIVCTKGVVAHIGLDQGLNHTQAQGTSRAMVNGSNYLNYELYTPTGSVWTTLNTVNYASTSKYTNNTLTVKAIIPAQQNVPASLNYYSDTITIIATF